MATPFYRIDGFQGELRHFQNDRSKTVAREGKPDHGLGRFPDERETRGEGFCKV